MAKLPANWKQKYLASKVLKQQQQQEHKTSSELSVLPVPRVLSAISPESIIPCSDDAEGSLGSPFNTIRQKCRTKLAHTLLAYQRQKNALIEENSSKEEVTKDASTNIEMTHINNIAAQIESALYLASPHDISSYKSAFRAHFLALRLSSSITTTTNNNNNNSQDSPIEENTGPDHNGSPSEATDFCHQLLNEQLSPKIFGELSTKDLRSYRLVQSDDSHVMENLRVKIVAPLPKTIQAYCDGRDREKWGVGRSAAAVEDGD